MLRYSIKVASLAAVLCTTVGLAACKTPGDVWSYEAADRLSAPENMNKRQITAEPYMVTVFEKVHKQGGVANIYFETDGDISHMGEKVLNKDTTPSYPLGLHLASRDNADNVISVARPCQYSGMEGKRPGTPCNKDAWSDGRYSIETLNAMNKALDKLKDRYAFTGYNLVGVDGGAAVAVMLAAKRKDVISLRTVAGILDTDRYEADHKRGPLTNSLNPKDFAKDVATIPQHHFLGNWDQDVTPDVYQSYKDAMGPSSCIRYSLVADVDHWKGWANRWNSLLTQPLNCTTDPNK